MFSSQMSPGSPFFVLTGDVVCTDVVGNGLPTLAFSRGIDTGEGRFWYGEGFRMVKSPLIVVPGNLTAVRYRDEILRPVTVPLVQQHQMTFQHDNARPHVARVCQDFLANNNIVPLDWPPYSPDLSPIEHLWDELDRRVRRRRNTPQHSRATANNIAGRVGEHPNEKNQRTGELHAKENQGGDKCERGTHQILTRCDVDFTIWGVPSKRL